MAFLFEFVREFSTELANLAERIEDKIFDEPDAAMVQARKYCEYIVQMISNEEELEAEYSLKHVDKIHRLYRKNVFDEDIYNKLEFIRRKGNQAAHHVAEVDVADAMQIHKFLFEISVWYMQEYVAFHFEAPAYKLPVKNSPEVNMDELIKPYLEKLHAMRAEFQRQIDEMRLEKQAVTKSEAAVTNEEVPSAAGFYLQFQNERLYLTTELAKMPIMELPVYGWNYLLTELSRVGIDSLIKITEPMDQLHLQVNGFGAYTLEAFWEKLKTLENITIEKTRSNSVKTIEVKEELQQAFEKNNFTLTSRTKKAAEFEHTITKEIVYLLPRKQLTIVLHPETSIKHFEVTEDPKHSTALRRFPKRIKNGQTPTNYGYQFLFKGAEELEEFLTTFCVLITQTTEEEHVQL